MAYAVLSLGLLGSACLFLALDAQASAIEQTQIGRARWMATELARTSAAASATLDRHKLAQGLAAVAATPELEALAAVAPSGDTLYAYGRGAAAVDRLLALEPGATSAYVVARAPLLGPGAESGQLRIALSNRPAADARALRDRAALGTALATLALAVTLLLFSQRRTRAHAAMPVATAATIHPNTLAPGRPAAAAKAAQMDDRLLHSIGREARNSLSNAIAMVELLLDSKLDPKQRRYAQTAEQSARSLLGTIDEVLEFARAADGQYPVRSAEFDLRQTVEDCVDRFASQAHGKDLELLCRIDADVPQFGLADADRLRQVLSHVIGNAVKFTERGEVVVHVRMESAAHADKRARIEVRDTGPGIANRELPALFEGLSGSDELLVRPNRGVGLGLAISKRVVEAMGGQIGVQSTQGAGSCFWFTLPVKSGAKPISLRPIALARRALVVDASRSAREVLKSQIERWQIDCDTTASAYDAFARLEAEARSPQPFDVIVIAERTSDLSGPELLRAIGGHPAARQVPIVLLTYKGSALGAAEIASVASAQLTKPASPSALHRCITNVVERRVVSMAAPRKSPELRRSGRPEAPRALVVDDNEINQFAVVELLTELGFAPDVARNGREAVEMATRQKYTIVLLDCEMPEMDGYEATREIRRSLSPGASVPIIALTAHNAPEERSKGLAAGMNEYMAKPVRQEALEATIVRWTSNAPEAPSPPSKKPSKPATASAHGAEVDSALAATESEPP